MLSHLADRAAAARGPQRILSCFLLGAVSALALPPFHLVPLLVPAFVGLLWLLGGADAAAKPWRAGFWIGFWFGFGHNLIGVHWIAEPLLVNPSRTGLLVPFALPGLASALAVFPAMACAAVVALPLRGTMLARVIGLAAVWALAEFVRGHIFTGFPWNLLGYVWAGSPAIMQVASLGGVLGLSTLTALAAGMPAVLADTRVALPSRLAFVAAGTVLLLMALWGGGAARLAASEVALVPDVRLRLVQANIAQRDKWDPQLRALHLDRHLALSRTPSEVVPTHVIWPETAVPFLLPNDTLARTRVTVAVPANGRLITGSVRSTYQNNERQLRNALVVLDDSADVAQVYDKSHLVPFGEYVPLRGVLPIDRVVPGQSDFVAGSGRRLLAIDGLPWVSPLICYEAIFSGRVTPPGERPGWMLNLTNDAWFGTFAGPQQPFAIASARAVEEGLPMVRVANTGISAVVDPYGRVVARLGIGERGILDSGLPMALPETIFARWGETIPVALAVFSLLFALMLGSRIKAP